MGLEFLLAWLADGVCRLCFYEHVWPVWCLGSDGRMRLLRDGRELVRRQSGRGLLAVRQEAWAYLTGWIRFSRGDFHWWRQMLMVGGGRVGGRWGGMTDGWRGIRFFHECRWRWVGRWWSLPLLRRWRRTSGFPIWCYSSAISFPIPSHWSAILFLPISWSFILPCRALIGCWVIMIGASGASWGLALELRVTKWTRLLDVEPLLQTASMEEMAAWSDHSIVHVLEGMSTNT